jgi:hypothetical protein
MRLDDIRWQSVPWELNPDSKSAQSHLLDILVAVPGLLEENDRIEKEAGYHTLDGFVDPSLTMNSSLRRTKLCDCIVAQLGKLYRWRWDWQRKYSRHVSVDPSGREPGGRATKAPGSVGNLVRLHFDRPVHANDIMLYNSALMWLLALLWKLEPLQAKAIIEDCANRSTPRSSLSTYSCYPTARSPTRPLPDFVEENSQCLSFEPLGRPGASVSIRDPAVEICLAYEWQSRNHDRCAASGDQTCLYLFPIGMARSVLDREPELMTWIQSMLDASPITSGYGKGGSNVAGFGEWDPQNVSISPTTVYVNISHNAIADSGCCQASTSPSNH